MMIIIECMVVSNVAACCLPSRMLSGVNYLGSRELLVVTVSVVVVVYSSVVVVVVERVNE
jgi:hypothetical protein